jgi:hypothetical protein
MVESILLNEMPLKTMKLKYEKLTVPDNMELLSEVIDLLQPLKEVTVLFSTSDFVSISFLFPAIFTLIEYTIPGFDFKFSHTKILKEELLRTIKDRFDYINQDQNEFIKVAAFLDFRYKKFHFIHDETVRNEQLSLVNESREHIEIQFSACRHLVGSFQHSEPLQKELKQLQKYLKQEYKIKLIQDCKIR